MDKLKQWIALTAVAVLAISAAGWFLLVSPKKSEAGELNVQADAQLATNDGLRTQVSVLKAQAKELPTQQAKLAAVTAKIPADPALPTLIRSLTAAADEAGVRLVSITPSPPTPLAAPVAAAPVAPVDTTSDEAAAPAVVAAPAASALLTVPVAINVVGSYFQVEQFVALLEGLPRALRISNLTVTPGADPTATGTSAAAGTDGSALASVITGQVYVTSTAGAPTPGAVATGTAASPAAAGVTAITTPSTPTAVTSPAPVTVE